MRPPPDISSTAGSVQPAFVAPLAMSPPSSYSSSPSATSHPYSRAPVQEGSPISRKPLPANGSPIAGRYSSSSYPSPRRRPITPTSVQRAISFGHNPSSPGHRSVPASPARSNLSTTDKDRRTPHRQPYPASPPYDYHRQFSPLSQRSLTFSNFRSSPSNPIVSATTVAALRRPNNARRPSSVHTGHLSPSDTEADDVPQSLVVGDHRTATMATYHTHNGSNGFRAEIVGTPADELPPGSKKTSPSKGKKITSFFNWKSNRSPSLDSPTTTFSEQSVSPGTSPMPFHLETPQRTLLAPVDVTRANASAHHSHFLPAPNMLPLPTPPFTSNQLAELEQELREVSAELAQSVRREMELEDEVERLKSEKSPVNLEAERRNSDYYSDSGAGSVRYPMGDSEGRIEELETLRRKTEQGKAQMKLDMSRRLEEALRHKRLAEERVEEILRTPGMGGGQKVRELESSLEEARRKVTDERQFRESYESLIAGMRLEMEQCRNERDNLRDEVVPQLQSKIEGLESEASDLRSLTYDNSRMQQELEALQSLKHHNVTSTIDEDSISPMISPTFPNIARSKSLMSRKGGRSRSNTATSRPTSIREIGLSRSNSKKEGVNESREELSQRAKDLQEQRDALHSTVKSLILRHAQMEKEHAKRSRKLEKEAEKLATSSPQRSAFQREVRNLREEITGLRRRADDALNQKWQCEKGLSGLKMDLDRAQTETASLRHLLQERDMFVPNQANGEEDRSSQRSHSSLDKAYEELRATCDLSLASIRGLDPDSSDHDTSHRILELLKQSISDAEAERDMALAQASQYRNEAMKLQQSELEHLSKESALATDLYASAQRMDNLASQVQSQIRSNSQLRNRLAEAIGRGEREQTESASRIALLQGQLRDLEDQLMTAQNHSEEVVTAHEDEVRDLQKAHNAQLQRVAGSTGATLGSPNMAPPTPVTPMFGLRSPRLDKTTSGLGMSLGEASRTGNLEKRVKELESALAEADKEMHEVVGRMNMAQIEVAELQGERDEAMMRTRRLQTEIQYERQKVQDLMAASDFIYPDDY